MWYEWSVHAFPSHENGRQRSPGRQLRDNGKNDWVDEIPNLLLVMGFFSVYYTLWSWGIWFSVLLGPHYIFGPIVMICFFDIGLEDNLIHYLVLFKVFVFPLETKILKELLFTSLSYSSIGLITILVTIYVLCVLNQYFNENHFNT